MTLGFDRKAMNTVEGRTIPYYIKIATILKNQDVKK